ncbi:TonB-dependent receptor, partial [Bacteroides ovatus]
AHSGSQAVMIYTPFNFTDSSDGSEPHLQLTNPLVSVADNARQQSRQTFNYNGSFTWEFIDNLKFKTEFGLDHYYNKDKRFYGVTTYNSRINGNNQPIAVFTSKERKTFRNTNTLNYDFKKILKNKDHSLSLLVGQELIKVKSNTDTDEVRFYPKLFTADQAFNLSSQGTAFSTDKFYNADDILLSYFARANYDFQGKYLASATFRADGSSKFSKDNRWGFFPSAALAWRMSSENFMESTKSWLDDLKLRISYGTAGNNNIPSDQTSTIWSAGSGASIGWMNNMSSYWTTGAQMANPDLKWETTEQWNAGLDLGFFDERIGITMDIYRKTTRDLLLDASLPFSSGYYSATKNIGKVRNDGLELSLNTVNFQTRAFKWTTNFNISFNKNKVLALSENQTALLTAAQFDQNYNGQSSYIAKVGLPMGLMYGYVYEGTYK